VRNARTNEISENRIWRSGCGMEKKNTGAGDSILQVPPMRCLVSPHNAGSCTVHTAWRVPKHAAASFRCGAQTFAASRCKPECHMRRCVRSGFCPHACHHSPRTDGVRGRVHERLHAAGVSDMDMCSLSWSASGAKHFGLSLHGRQKYASQQKTARAKFWSAAQRRMRTL